MDEHFRYTAHQSIMNKELLTYLLTNSFHYYSRESFDHNVHVQGNLLHNTETKSLQGK